MARWAPIAALLAALAVPSAAAAAPPAPFGHACAPRNSVLFCPTADLAQRVPSFDGTPIDVDVTLPPTGDGPFPTIVMLHGYSLTKTWLDAATTPDAGTGTPAYHYNPVYYASRGYAVVSPSARGFGNTCGKSLAPDPACAKGYIHLADQRQEVRDTQTLLGRLVDEGVTRPDAIGVTGISYGGGQSAQLALLRDKVRLADGSFAPWTSPKGTALRVAAAFPRWLWSDLGGALQPNGRFLDFGRGGGNDALSPLGVRLQSWTSVLTVVSGTLAPKGSDPTADFTTWNALADAGEPYGAQLDGALKELHTFHSAIGLVGAAGLGAPAPLLLQNGWTDDLFPVTESLRLYNELRRRDRGAEVALQLGDLGHNRGSNKANVEQAFNDAGSAFFDAWLKGAGAKPAPGSVTAFTQTCPRPARGAGPYRAKDWASLHRGAVRFGAARPQRVTSAGGNAGTAQNIDPFGSGGDACKTVRRETVAGTATATLRARGFTLLGRTTVRAAIRTTGKYGQLDARLWDVAPAGTQRLVDRGGYRLTPRQRGTVLFQLHGNGYRFGRGHTVKLELVGRDAPYLRASNGSFSVRVSKLAVELPTLERPSRARGIAKPRLAR